MLVEYLTRGVKAGVVAGLVFGLFLAVAANPLVAHADAVNHAADETDHGVDAENHADAHGHGAGGSEGGDHHETAASAAVDEIVSVLAGAAWAVALGGVFFGLAFYLLEPAIPGTGATKSYLLGAAGFVTVSGAPWLALPPASPGAQQSLAVATRLPLYAGMMIAGAVACLLAGYAYNRLAASNGRVLATLGASLSLCLLAVPAALAPANAVRGALSPELRNGLVGLSVFGQVVLWLVLSAAHAQLRSGEPSGTDRSTTDARNAATAD
ncbi:CbtA family protein [Haloarcula nitratireducens]|uniref:CbtA family protein n=1 Tax=Haloarcula nitratireducens TaxID=2487749 RepID=A0AAW4PID1_9EURY|nr:CbtA family protein [Halomicroarcula nitratireducens]MBX0297318.1 CbtA family protein [Halomicroarcula nitratireducens]